MSSVACSVLVVSERSDDAEHFFEGDEASTMYQLVFVDGCGQFFRVGRQLAVAVRELASFGTRRGSRTIVVPAINERSAGAVVSCVIAHLLETEVG